LGNFFFGKSNEYHKKISTSDILTIKTPIEMTSYFVALKKVLKPVKKGLIHKKMLTFHP